MKFPPLAGLCSYEDAARIGIDVDETVQRLVRYAWINKRLTDYGLYWINPTPEWEVKEGLSLHTYLATEHAALMRKRVSEMRNPPPRMDIAPDDRIQRFLTEILAAESTLEKLAAVYGVLRPALLSEYRKHYDAANPLVDYPTRRLLRSVIIEEEETVHWGTLALEALGGVGQVDDWCSHLQAYLEAAGGITGLDAASDTVPPSRHRKPFTPDFYPRRDSRFVQQENFVFPPHAVARMEGVSDEEKTLALMCKRTLEMDVPEVMARMIAESEKQPWEYYVDMTRQLWDEARHAMMGSVYLQHHRIDWKRDVPLHPGFSIRLNQHMSALEAHAVLYTIEQSLMPADTGKKYEWVTADAAGDPLAKFFQDYDWADEVLHVHIGREWGLASSGMSRAEFVDMGQRKATESEGVLEAYADPAKQVNWWPEFVERTLGKTSTAQDRAFDTSDPVYRKAGT
ncbi:MAG: hypothetical protein SF123_24565 [Chloroflexota bacterium]|nr:hypothetical protein [Chloroflexota bacterium]